MISNAVKFATKDHVELQSKTLDRCLLLSVMDGGLGMEDNELPFIFNSFYKLESKSVDSEIGMGIGLAIVQKLAKLINAVILVESSLTKGSVFSLRIPIRNPV